jgi:hypothetical protein
MSSHAFPAMISGKRRHSRRRRPAAWPAMWLAVGVLLVQMIAMEFHHHSLFEVDNDCPSCQLDAMHPAPTPSTPVAVPVPVLAFVFYIAVEPAPYTPPDIRSYLSPYPQAPPPVLHQL